MSRAQISASGIYVELVDPRVNRIAVSYRNTELFALVKTETVAPTIRCPFLQMAFNFLAGQITRTWEVKAGDNVYQIQLHHHSLSGQRYLTLNGREVPGSEVWPILRDLDDILKVQQGRTTMLSNAETISFDIGEKLGSVSIASGAGRFVYTCFFDGETLVEDNEKGGRKEHEDVYDIDIPDAVEGVDEKGSRVVWYTLHTTRESDNSKTVVHRRFRDFFSLNEEVRDCADVYFHHPLST